MITREEMKALAGYEVSFTKYIQTEKADNNSPEFEDVYGMTLNDLERALNNMLKGEKTTEEVRKEWFMPLSMLGETFVPKVGTFVTEGAGRPLVRILPFQEEDLYFDIWSEIDYLCYLMDDDIPVREAVDEEGACIVGECLEKIRCFRENEGKSVQKMSFTKKQSVEFITAFENDEFLYSATAAELELARGLTDKLVKEHVPQALHLKGYACYGGNDIYPCDWFASRDCLQELFDMTDDPVVANTLGYIYYYGRCNGEVPEYEKAYDMFVIAAVGGVIEGQYKLADMFRHGYACRKSERTAKSLYEKVYGECLDRFLEGYIGNFPDAALRMGGVYLYGIGTEKDPETAMHFLMQAGFASEQRVKKDSFFGYANVARNIRMAMEEAKSQLPESYQRSFLSVEYPYLAEDLCQGGHQVSLTVECMADGSLYMKCKRKGKGKEKEGKAILITVPEIGYCDMTGKVKLYAQDAKTSMTADGRTTYIFDQVKANYRKERDEFYLDGELVGWVKTKEYRFFGSKKAF